MFRKRKEPARDNTESQVTMEQIRRRMVANVAGSDTSWQADAELEGTLAMSAVASDYPVLPEGSPNYDAVSQNLKEAVDAGALIAQASRRVSTNNGGRRSVGSMLRNSMRWYTAPEEAYWKGVLGGMDRILAALKAHDAVMKIHTNAIRSVQQHSAALTQQLSEIPDVTMPNPKETEEGKS